MTSKLLRFCLITALIASRRVIINKLTTKHHLWYQNATSSSRSLHRLHRRFPKQQARVLFPLSIFQSVSDNLFISPEKKRNYTHSSGAAKKRWKSWHWILRSAKKKQTKCSVNCKDKFAHRLRHQQVIAGGRSKSKNNILLLRHSRVSGFFFVTLLSKMH